MSTRTLTPDDPHPPRRDPARFLPWSFLVALLVAPVLVFAGVTMGAEAWDDASGDEAGASSDGPAILLVLTGLALFAYALIGAPVYKWGPSGILLVLGLLIVLAGFAGAIGTRVAEDVTTTLYDGDDDRDGRTNEDDFGDADGSASDPAQVSHPNELMDHDDDDGDGRVDEDPAPVYQTRSEVRAGLAVSRQVSIGAVVLGLVLLGAFAFIQSSGRRQPEPAPAAPPAEAPTVTHRDGGGR